MPVILVVDDQPSNREVLITLLGYYGHRVVEAGDGVEGLAVAEREQPDLVISDVLMPTMDGYEFVRRLREHPKLAAKPVVFYTAFYLEKEALALAEKCGVSYVIAKPCEPASVIEIVNTAIGAGAAAGVPHGVSGDHLELITTRLSKTADELARANAQLEALVDAAQRVATELDPQRLVDQYANVARQIVGAGMCAIGILDEAHGNWSHVAVSGVSEDEMTDILARWRPDGKTSNFHVCDPDHIGIAVQTVKSFYGWLCVAGKLGGGSFSEDDERLMRTIAAQLAIGYENRRLLAQAQAHADELEERVRVRTHELEAAQQELESFTFAVSHDLRAPLHNLTGFTSILEERFGQRLDPGANELVQRIQRTSCQMAELVKNLLELSRVSKEDLRLEAVSLNEVLADALAEARKLAGERRIDWRIHSLPAVIGHRLLLTQVFVNLLSNAVKFTGRTEAAVIEVGQTTIGSESPIYVRDNGAGFDPTHAGRLFGVFQRLHSQNEFPGTGAGLAIVQRIVQRHGGRIWAASSPGKGAEFFFTLGGV